MSFSLSLSSRMFLRSDNLRLVRFLISQEVSNSSILMSFLTFRCGSQIRVVLEIVEGEGWGWYVHAPLATEISHEFGSETEELQLPGGCRYTVISHCTSHCGVFRSLYNIQRVLSLGVDLFGFKGKCNSGAATQQTSYIGSNGRCRCGAPSPPSGRRLR